MKNVARYAAAALHITVVVEEYHPSMRSITDACCRLLEANVTSVVAKSTSTETAVEADYLSPLKIPLVAVSASDPYLPTPDRDYLLRMSPPDTYQVH